jgi:hypothetical protein
MFEYIVKIMYLGKTKRSEGVFFLKKKVYKTNDQIYVRGQSLFF